MSFKFQVFERNVVKSSPPTPLQRREETRRLKKTANLLVMNPFKSILSEANQKLDSVKIH